MARAAPFNLAILDLDGTLRREPDPWLHLHRHLRTGAEGEKYYRRWRAGEISYNDLCRLDAAEWRGVTREKILQALANNPLREGAREVITFLKEHGITCVGLSTGLSVFHEVTARELGLAEVLCNELSFRGDTCAGEVLVNVTEDSKSLVMEQLMARYVSSDAQTLVFGDGRADIPMLKRAGLSVAVFPRSEEVARSARYVIDTEPLTGALAFLQAELT